MKKKKEIYCIYCGQKNLDSDKCCCNCKKKLHEKRHDFYDYLKEKVKSKVTDNIEGNILDFIKLLIRKYLYGIILGASVIFVTSGMIYENNNKINTDITKVDSKPIGVLSDEQKLLGCWHSHYEIPGVVLYRDTYYKFISLNELYVSYDEVTVNYQGVEFPDSDTYLREYELVEVTAYGDTYTLFRLPNPNLGEELWGDRFSWVNDNTFETEFEVFNRIDCNDFPVYE